MYNEDYEKAYQDMLHENSDRLSEGVWDNIKNSIEKKRSVKNKKTRERSPDSNVVDDNGVSDIETEMGGAEKWVASTLSTLGNMSNTLKTMPVEGDNVTMDDLALSYTDDSVDGETNGETNGDTQQGAPEPSVEQPTPEPEQPIDDIKIGKAGGDINRNVRPAEHIQKADVGTGVDTDSDTDTDTDTDTGADTCGGRYRGGSAANRDFGHRYRRDRCHQYKQTT
jgi:hypothetical protein